MKKYSENEEIYYWYFDKKIKVKYNLKTWIVKSTDVNDSQTAEFISEAMSKLNATRQLTQELARVDFNEPVNLGGDSKTDTFALPSLQIIDETDPIFMTGNIVIMPNEKTNIRELEKDFNIREIEKLNYGTYLMVVLNPNLILETANAIHESGLVQWCAPDFYVNIIPTGDPLFRDQYYLHQSNNIDINAPEAWLISEGSSSIKIAVIDDGVDDHEEFGARLLPGFTPGSNNTLGRPINFNEGHGVCCAGIIAAANDNYIGIKGIAPSCEILPIKVLGDGATYGYTNSEVATAITWAYQTGNADVLSNSWGVSTPGFYDANIAQAITNARTLGRGGKGCIVVFSSGNSNQAFSGVTFPANVAGVITVGAINSNGAIWNYSSRGPEMDLVCPSGNVNLLGDVTTTDRMGSAGYETGNYTNRFGGTSAACPQVAGVAALMLSVAPNLTETQVRTFLQQSARDLGTSGFDNTFGYGLLNAGAAVTLARNTVTNYILGKRFICSSQVYEVKNLPANSTVTWSIPSGTGTVLTLTPDSPSINKLTITNQKYYSLKTTLTATVVTSGGAPKIYTFIIQNDNYSSFSGSYTQLACITGGVQHPAESGVATTSQATFVHMGCEVRVNMSFANDFKAVTLAVGTPIYWNWDGNKLYFALPLGSSGTPFTFRIGSIIPNSNDGQCDIYLHFFPFGDNT